MVWAVGYELCTLVIGLWTLTVLLIVKQYVLSMDTGHSGPMSGEHGRLGKWAKGIEPTRLLDEGKGIILVMDIEHMIHTYISS